MAPLPSPGSPLRLAVTLGDPAGIGPEVVAAAARLLRPRTDAPRLLIVGPVGTAADEVTADLHEIGQWRADGDRALAGGLAARAIREAAKLALAGRVDAVVTAPIDKAALHAAGEPFSGHTDMLAALSGAREVSMFMCAENTLLGGPLRVALATTHVPLARVPGMVNTELLVGQARIVDAALRRGWAMESPRIALCAFNPHASDDGLFGDEEARVYAPALERLRAGGVDASGPYSADTVFLRAARGAFDAVIAPYHDVGMAAFKTASFGRGVNVTLGLPFIRTSPDHGTAKDIAGSGLADPASMLAAIELAARLAARYRTATAAP